MQSHAVSDLSMVYTLPLTLPLVAAVHAGFYTGIFIVGEGGIISLFFFRNDKACYAHHPSRGSGGMPPPRKILES